MITISGLIYKDRRFEEGHIIVSDNGYEIKPGIMEGADHNGIIIPKFINCHTHIGDSAIPRPPKGTVEEIVGPPDGYKHRMLRQTSEEDIVQGMRKSIRIMESNGIGRFIDFREEGIKGTRQLSKSMEDETYSDHDGRIKCDIYARPENNVFDQDEIDNLLEVSTGLGISAISDWDYDELKAVGEYVAGEGQTLALHASERSREDIDKILDLKPKFLVHMIHASDDDLALCADGGIPIIICPRSNAFFGTTPPIERMLAAGIDICLGTDNMMLVEPDMFGEMEFLRNSISNNTSNHGMDQGIDQGMDYTVGDEKLLNIMLDNSRKVLNSNPDIGVEPWGQDGFIVIDRPTERPASQVIGSSPKDIRFMWRSQS